MKDVKDILGEAQEKMDMAVMYLEDTSAPARPTCACWTASA